MAPDDPKIHFNFGLALRDAGRTAEANAQFRGGGPAPRGPGAIAMNVAVMKAKLLLLLPAAAIVLAGIWVYAPALHGDWLWDDGIEVSHNPVLREPAGAVGRIWFAPEGEDYFPLKTTVQWAEWHLWGDHRLGYHLTSLALHLLSALLFWRLLRRLVRAGGKGREGGRAGGRAGADRRGNRAMARRVDLRDPPAGRGIRGLDFGTEEHAVVARSCSGR